MKTLTTFLLFIFSFSITKADYDYLSLCEMVQKADYGVLGTILKVDKNYFYIKVDNYILNTLELDTLAIIKFEDWACAQKI